MNNINLELNGQLINKAVNLKTLHNNPALRKEYLNLRELKIPPATALYLATKAIENVNSILQEHETSKKNTPPDCKFINSSGIYDLEKYYNSVRIELINNFPDTLQEIVWEKDKDVKCRYYINILFFDQKCTDLSDKAKVILDIIKSKDPTWAVHPQIRKSITLRHTIEVSVVLEYTRTSEIF